MPRLAPAIAVPALAAAGLASLAACGHPASAAERSFPVTAFDSVSVGGSENVVVTTGRAHAVVASGPQKRLDQLDIRVEGGTLKIRTRPGSWSWGMGEEVRIAVSLPELHGASVSGSADMVADRGSGRAFAAKVSGSGNLTIRQLVTDSATLAVSGSGDISVAGRCNRATMQVSGSGDISAPDLACRDLTAAVAGSGDIVARASGTATATASGSGNVTIRGGARCTSRESGSGEVSCG